MEKVKDESLANPSSERDFTRDGAIDVNVHDKADVHKESLADCAGQQPPVDANESNGVAQVQQQRQVTGFAWAFIVVSLISSTFLYALDNTVIATVRPSMIRSLGSIDLLPWISAAYPMTETGSNPFWLVLTRRRCLCPPPDCAWSR